jgi:hypothetical protein
LDYPAVDPPDWHKLATVRLNDGQVEYGDMPLDYFLREPYAKTFKRELCNSLRP